MQVLRFPEVQKRVGLGRSSIYAAIAKGTFPAPIKLNAGDRSRANGWIPVEIDQYLADRIAERDRVRAGSAAGKGVA
jgi:prophage regulatory protein